jgi:two-component system, sensor histidine kinase and response regulator
MVVVSVKDTGCGIKEDAQAKLLKIDTHFSTFGTNKEEGSGLGLLLCLDFVQKNGGRLWFESKEGVGTTFYFSIPKESASKDDASPPSDLLIDN